MRAGHGRRSHVVRPATRGVANRRTASRPNAKPPMWAKNATPPPSRAASTENPPDQSWKRNQRPRNDDRRDLEEEEERPDKNARPGKQDEVGAEHPGDRPACAHARDALASAPELTNVTIVCVAVATSPADDVEGEVADAAHGVLDVVAEDPEEEHVAEQVIPTAVQEHRRERGDDPARPELRAGAVTRQGRKP